MLHGSDKPVDKRQNFISQSTNYDGLDIHNLCRKAINKVMSRNRWLFLIDEGEFTDLVVAETRERLARGVQKSDEEIAIDSTIYCYCHIWHFHCISEDKDLRDRGYNLVSRYTEALLPSLLTHYGRGDLLSDVWFQQDIAQEITIKVANSINAITQPGAFLSYIKMVGIRTVKDVLAKKQLPLVEPHQSDNNESESDDPLDLITVAEQTSKVELDELAQTLVRVIETCLTSEAQQVVMKLHLIGELDVREIAKELQIPVKQVSQYKTRAMGKLKSCPAFIDFVDGLVLPKNPRENHDDIAL